MIKKLIKSIEDYHTKDPNDIVEELLHKYDSEIITHYHEYLLTCRHINEDPFEVMCEMIQEEILELQGENYGMGTIN